MSNNTLTIVDPEGDKLELATEPSGAISIRATNYEVFSTGIVIPTKVQLREIRDFLNKVLDSD